MDDPAEAGMALPTESTWAHWNIPDTSEVVQSNNAKYCESWGWRTGQWKLEAAGDRR